VRAPPFSVRAAALAEIIALRHAVLRPGLPRRAAEFDGDGEPATRHFGAFLAETGENVGCLSFTRRPWRGAPGYQLRGMATRPDLARRGVGSALLRFAERALRAEQESGLLWCNARATAVAFYEKLGWVVVSGPFDIPTVGPHYAMVRR
jgi:GNAT superfamily N-acetyltransferase